MVSALPSPAPAAPVEKVSCLSLMHLRFACGVAGDTNLPPIWDAVSQGQGKTEGLATLNQPLMRGLLSFRRVFGRRAHSSAPLPLLDFVRNVSLMNPSLNPSCNGGGGFTPWLTWQGTVKASTRGGSDASLLAQQLDGHLVLAESLQTAASPPPAAIQSV